MINKSEARFHRIYLLILTCLLSLWEAKAQEFRVIELPNQEQLPVANVHRIMQDSEGYMWYATEGGGLCRDDGYRVDVFRSDKNHTSPLESNNIVCMTENTNGGIWFGTDKGAYFLDKNDYSIHRLEEQGIRGAYIYDIHCTKDGSLWISTASQIFRCGKSYTTSDNSDNDKNMHADSFPTAWNGHPCHTVNFYEDDRNGLLAILHNGGILHFHPKKKVFEAMKWDAAAGNPSYIDAGETKDELWLATWGRGIFKYRPDAGENEPCLILQAATIGKDSYGSFRNQLLNIRYDRRHSLLWAVSMDDLYAYRTDKDSLYPYPTDDFIPKGKKILDHVTFDRNGNLWVPGYSPHTFIVQPVGMQIRRDPVKAMSDITGYKVMVDRIVRENGRYYWIWQGRTNLSLYDALHRTMVFSNRMAVPKPLSTAKCLEKRHNALGIWTCNGKRLYHVWNQDLDILHREVVAVKVNENIRTLFDNGKGCLYLGTDNAIYRYDYQTERCQQMAGATGSVLELTESSDGTVCFISESKGLCHLKKTGNSSFRLHAISSETEASPKGFCTLATAPDGTIWAGTSHGSVFHYRPDGGQPEEDEKAGNKNGDAIKKIVVDKGGHVWILSDKYLKEYFPKNQTFQMLHCSSPQIGMDYFHTICTEDDSICLGGIGAFCMIAPSESINEEATPPTVCAWSVNGLRRLPGIGTRCLKWETGTENMEFFVSTFDYLHTDSIQFAYRWGNADEWTLLPKGQNRISPERIPYGTSELEVKATDRYGIWQAPVVCLTLERRPHWAVTASIYLLLILATTGCVVLYTRKHKKRIIGHLSHHRKKTAAVPSPEEQAPSAAPSKADDDFLRKAIETIERNIDNADYSVEQFSNDMCMSRMNMYRKLQTLTAQKPSEFIRDIRMRKAIELMTSTDLSISEIVDHVGFGTSRYFSKCFKDKFGVSPSQYRSHRTDKDADGLL